MTYSNTNKDNFQANWLSKVKNLVVTFLLLLSIFYSGVNIINQYQTLTEANRVRLEKEANIMKLKDEISSLKQNIEYATSSAYSARRMRQFYGMGLAGDKWIAMDKNIIPSNIGQNFNLGENKPNVVLWFEKFTN